MRACRAETSASARTARTMGVFMICNAILLVSDSWSTRSTSMSDGENDKEREAASQLSAREESEVIDILHQILEDADPCQLSAYTILERVRDEYESE